MSSVDHSASWESSNPNQRRDVISRHAYTSGMKTGAMTVSVVGAGVLAANKYLPAFRNRLNASGKTALVVMSFLASFTVEAEGRLVKEEKTASKLKLWERGANFLYDHPYRALATAGVPLVGGIYSYQHLNKGISVSQQVMHTRIYGQAAVVVLLLSSMAFHDYMAKRGKFGEEEEAQS
ncbi:hypothetical protein JG688_00006306 [Phytophthora aleatoria]|uniref:HIG1 domain-containing protein n=1 Tax=Phytophthora aleatoria TaxID=2496075 RepID=A0A8J5ITV8_9STRA|nr:hypothetical protein JG688_00006306 [Phytophthora aleatoria]